jgi:hypothetical protein
MRASNNSKNSVLLCLVFLLLTSCQTIPKDALELSQESLRHRQLETRRFDTKDEVKLLSASAQVLQDLGFTVDESETKLGVITCSKDRSAVKGWQVALAILAALGGGRAAIDTKQTIRVSLATRPLQGKETLVRVTFQHVVWNTDGKITEAEELNDPKLYQEFFAKLSESVFLTANEI